MISMKALNFILLSSLAMALFAAPANAQSEVVLHTFQGPPNDGAYPEAGLINVGGVLYGTTFNGGASNLGTVFKITTAGGEAVLHSFGSGTDGIAPAAGLVNVGGMLYGTTVYGGAHCPGGCGTLFSVTTSGVEAVLHSFRRGTEGGFPYASVINVGGILYGTTRYGGTGRCTGGPIRGCGTVYKMTTAGVETLLYSFKGRSDGAFPAAGLIEVGGELYGTTSKGGTANLGTVFKITTAGIETVLHSFQGVPDDGANPNAGLINVGGVLYGTTSFGGPGCSQARIQGCGSVFKITTAGVETVLHFFRGALPGTSTDGAFPSASLIEVGGELYGTTSGGGSLACDPTTGCGTVFKITTAGVETLLYSFKGGSDGIGPEAGLVNVGGVLYGTTINSGSDTTYGGTVFKVTP